MTMKHLIIIGARGYGREVYYLATHTKEFQNQEFDVKGFLDDKSDALDGLNGDFPLILGPVETYEIQNDDVFICALGDSHYRKKYAEIILGKGGEFISLISQSAVVYPTATIGKGCIISNGSVISDNVVVGDFSSIQSYDIFGHDVKIGKYVSVESFCFFGGYVEVGDLSTIHHRSSVIPHKKLGNEVVVGAASVVMRNVKDGLHVYGNPAKKLDIE